MPSPPLNRTMPRTQAAQDGSPGLQVQGNGTGGANDNVTPDANFMPPLARRSSFEPMRLGALPPPVFSKNAPVGQRSVPAVEYLKQEAAAAVSAAAPAIGTTTPGAADGTVTPGAGLGNGLMSKEPWNLWTDSSAPTAAGADLPTSKASDINPTVSLTQDNADEDLALALAAVVVLNGEDGADGKSKSSKRSSLIAPARTAAWPEEFASTAGSASATFALDPAASPQGSLKTNSGSANLSTSVKPSDSSILPRNVSFSSMLDLPRPNDSMQTSPPAAIGSGGSHLRRTNSLNRAVSGPVGSGLPGTGSRTSSPTAALRSVSGIPAVTAQPSDVSTVPSLAFSGSGSFASPQASYHASAAPGNPYGHGFNNAPAGRFAHGLGNGSSGFDFGYEDGSATSSSGGLRSRQPSAFSDTSVASMPFGGMYGAPRDPFAASMGVSDFFGGNGAGGPQRRDSGYGLSVYNSSPALGTGANDRQSRRGGPWQYAGRNGGAAGSDFGYPSHFMSPQPSYLGSPDPSYMGSISSPHMSPASSTGMYRYGSDSEQYGASGYGAGMGLGLGYNGMPGGYGYLHGSAGPFQNAPDPYYDTRPTRKYEDKRIIRSPLLEAFRADKTKRWGVEDMRGHIAEFMTDQVGSRYLQEHILENPTQEDCDLIYEEVCPVILQLSTDVFANFCCQRLFESARPEQTDTLVMGLQGSILRLSLQTYGCRVIQKAIEVVSPDKQVMIIRELETSVQKCVRDQNCNHVIQKIFQTCPADSLQTMVSAFVGHVYSFATHPYSCRVLQRILENCPERMTRPILDELIAYSQNLMQDQYGNYVIQYVLEKGSPNDKSAIIAGIYGQVLHLSKHKFASNVIEKCITNANEHEIHLIASECLAPRNDGATGIQSMLRHEYANYVLQRLIKHTTGQMQAVIVGQVYEQLAFYRTANPPFIAKHLAAVEKLLFDLAPQEFPSLMPRRIEDHYMSRRDLRA